MSTAVLDSIRRDMRALTQDELREIRHEIDRLTGGPVDPDEHRFADALLADGLLVDLPLPDPDPSVHDRRRLARVSGEPVSVTLVRDRR